MDPGTGAGAGAGAPPATSIDWTRPWLAPYRADGEAVAVDLAAGWPVHAALERRRGADPRRAALLPRFVPQAALPPGTAYEAWIAAERAVPTRDDLHDLFNGLVWLAFPALKWALNRRQASEIAGRGVGPRRGAWRDALTLFDENGAWLALPPEAAAAWAAHDWRALFGRHRAAWAAAAPVVFGHALLERLLRPRKALCAHAWRVDAALPGPADPGAVAGALAAGLDVAMAPPRHRPLPVLGVPGWWPANADPAFYDDPAVFRPAPARRAIIAA
ncbi:DUF3025 domain-containing protein [Piscinibacter sakaiensis]|nr:DUF3025 domain-containing protein [Piscinibacter sakaiensis]